MANSDHTTPAPAGKVDEAERLIAKSLIILANAQAGLRQIQNWPRRNHLADEMNMLKGIANDITDVNIGIEATLEGLLHQH